MAGARQAVRALGKSDPIDALAVARAALGGPDLPTAGHDQASWKVKLLVVRALKRRIARAVYQQLKLTEQRLRTGSPTAA